MTPIPESENLTVLAEGIESLLVELLHSRRSPSAWELVHEVETNVGYKARLVVKDVLANSCEKSALPGDFRTYLQSLLVVPEDAESSELEKALSGAAPPRHEVQSGIDSLI